MFMFRVLQVMRKGPALPAPYRLALTHKPTFLAKLATERWVALSNAAPRDLKLWPTSERQQ